jgi:CRP-like cAMP-binding protein
MHELDLEPGTVLFDADQPINHVYFPLKGIVSLLVVAEDGTDVEAAAIGNEGSGRPWRTACE